MENRTLYVGNLDNKVTEELVSTLFGQLGEVRSCKMFREPKNDPYCFVEFSDHICAINGITMMNDKYLQGRKMRVDWATGQGTKSKYTKVDTSNHFHIYVGDLSPEIDEEALKEAFKVFGEISDCKIVKDPQSLKPRGYAFVMFVKKMDAETAIVNMNGQWLGRKMIKVRWATRKPTGNLDKPDNKKLTYEEVFNQTTPTNTTVFCGGLKSDVTEETLQDTFALFGQIEKIRIFKEKGYAFIKYACKDNATEAIVNMHSSSINGQIIRCSWGKDTGQEITQRNQPDWNCGSCSQPQAPQPVPATNFNDQLGYWPSYPQQIDYSQYYSYQSNSGYMWMGWGQQHGWGQPPQTNKHGSSQPQER